MTLPADQDPLQFEQDGTQWRLRLVGPQAMSLELPASYSETLLARLSALFDDDPQATLLLDLQNLPAVSSRQLGMMLEVQKAARIRHVRLPITGVSRAVRELLDTTRTAQFFDIQS